MSVTVDACVVRVPEWLKVIVEEQLWPFQFSPLSEHPGHLISAQED